MPCLILAEDRPDMGAAREAVRDAHRAHLASARDRLLASGALLSESGESIGGTGLLDVDTEVEALRFEREDPHAAAGIRATVTAPRRRLRWWRGMFDAEGFEAF